jgi:hypothetical protein
MNTTGGANTRTVSFWMGNVDTDDTSVDARMRLTGSNSTTVIQLNNMEPQETPIQNTVEKKKKSSF